MTPTSAAVAKELAAYSFGAGWDKPEPSLWAEPRRDFLPFQWEYVDAVRELHRAGKYVSVEDAERRNLICINPMVGNAYATTPNIVAAYQMVLPNESPGAHQHTPSALRIAIDVSPGTFTVVNGTRIDMSPGDVLLTPNWMWHSHGNESDDEAYWIDLLNVPLIHHLRTMFFDHHPDRIQKVERVEPNSAMRFNAPALALAAAESAPGLRRSSFGSEELLTIGLEAVWLAAGSSWVRGRSTVNNIYVPLSGEIRIEFDEGEGHFVAHRGDVVAIPLWREHRVVAEKDSIFVRASDEPIIKYLKLYREENAL